MCQSNNTGRRQLSEDSYKTPNYANLVPQSQLLVVAQLQLTFVNEFSQNVEIDTLGPDQTSATSEEVPLCAITTAHALLSKLQEQKTSQIDFFAKESSEKQFIEAKKLARPATYLVTRKRPPKHHNPPVQPMLAFDLLLTDLERKLMQQY
ncbi:MAG: hypothetical protein EZS28_019975 [Streblomastix strix]|uniref:Uncharacterized protein n=1 Tax=Streblomastix strix TaxID=222440 RepID=A0A5J4VPT3_9EUKA|nr:MAG: hypothetical protein EZS28_019975 [Streblomastix strix]